MLGRVNPENKLIGGDLLVTAPPKTLVEITKGANYKQKMSSVSGKALFRGVDTGIWTVTITDALGKQYTKTVDVKTEYSLSFAFFSATITASYPVGSVCSIRNSNGETLQTAANQTGNWTFSVGRAGTYTVFCTNGTDSDSKTVTITADLQQKSVRLSYNEIPVFTYTGNYAIVNDNNQAITSTKGNWKIRFLTSGTLTFSQLNGATDGIDIFLCGGGGGGGGSHGGGGGGGYTQTQRRVKVSPTTYAIVVGAGGNGGGYVTGGVTQRAPSGGQSSFGSYTVNGGQGGESGVPEVDCPWGCSGGDGGSGGGVGAQYLHNKNGDAFYNTGTGGTDGSNGETGGTGQGSTTREFAESTGTLYAGGGNGGSGSNGASSGSANFGGGGGGGSLWSSGLAGYSGIVVIRNAR